MKAVHESQTQVMQQQRMARGPTRRTVLGALGASAFTVAARAQGTAQVEVLYNSFLDPASANDPRSAAQTRMIEAFERANPRIKVRVVVDPTGQNAIRATRTRADSPDVFRNPNFTMPEFAATGSLLPLDELFVRDGIDPGDWLLPLEGAKVNGRLWGLQQDYRIPILTYRKSRFAQAQVASTPRTYEEIGALGARLTQGNVIAFAIPIGLTGGIGGAQAFVEFIISSMLAGNEGPFFAPDGRAIGFTDERLVLAAEIVRDLFGRYRASTPVTLQFGFNELQDALRAGTAASATFGLYRYKGLQRQIANDDLAWAAAPSIGAQDKHTVYGQQLCINANSPRKDAAWEFVKFMVSPEAQAMAARGGEVVARTSAYNDSYFQSPEAADQLSWKQLVQERGRSVTYSIIQSTFNQIIGEAFQRMILRGATPQAVLAEVKTRYADALSRG